MIKKWNSKKRLARMEDRLPCLYHDPMQKPCTCIRPAKNQSDVDARRKADEYYRQWNDQQY